MTGSAFTEITKSTPEKSLTVRVKNTAGRNSYGKITRWHWDFGDGTTSDEQNPIHTYPRDFAHYVVTLTVEGPGGSARCCKVWEVCVRDTKHPSNTPYD